MPPSLQPNKRASWMKTSLVARDSVVGLAQWTQQYSREGINVRANAACISWIYLEGVKRVAYEPVYRSIARGPFWTRMFYCVQSDSFVCNVDGWIVLHGEYFFRANVTVENNFTVQTNHLNVLSVRDDMIHLMLSVFRYRAARIHQPFSEWTRWYIQ